ncbi:class I SAM-dependent methyltransferase [Helicobacter sp. XJK30-2]|uniref:Class I SAM-dependent methyltransferase n=1 Tax=Helicobacter zhangjianzhongii TaxID=2974574 RepID=A0ACC6FUB4_9HELI|nr:class I SAM-dependent methyltransferase [Helicobacter sp. XJK30-2]MDL0082507.1 class I SAM-dependent methyltransferase [Helicobacter sp. XJK30-2]
MSEYFEARGVSLETYKEAKLPAYFEEVICQLPKHARILDFGCGFGQNLLAIKKCYCNFADSNGGGGGEYKLLGIDINPKAIAYVQSVGIEAIVYENILDFSPQDKFDLVITTHVLEHLPKEQVVEILSHFKNNILKEGGKMFIAVPNAQSHTGCYWAYEDFTHNTLFTAGSLIYVLKMAGFTHIDIIDQDALAGTKGVKRIIRKFFLQLYKLNFAFWNRITNSAFHTPSPQIFSYEIKVLAY